MSKILKEIICITITISFIIPTFIVTAEKAKGTLWTPVTEDGFGNLYNVAIRGMGVYRGELYIGTENHNKTKKLNLTDKIEALKILLVSKSLLKAQQYKLSLKGDGCEIWKYNATTSKLQQIVGDTPDASIKSGFGNIRNTDATFFKEYKDKLYVGTRNSFTEGCEVWRYDGNSWEQVVKGGFGDPSNYAAWSVEVFKDKIYIGTMSLNESKSGFCQVWRSSDGNNWTKVVDRGFRDFDTTEKTRNTDARTMMVYNGWLYVGTTNMQKLGGHNGCQLWRASDGENWFKVELTGGDGFGEPGNSGIFSMEIYNEWLYVGTASLKHNRGFEIWKYNGTTWIPVIGDDAPGVNWWNIWSIKNDGFGDRNNVYAFSMLNCSNKLWVGTVNILGCELYCYDGENWKQIIGNKKDSEMGKGFGNKETTGIRSLIEYPHSSGILFAGTSITATKNFACQLWMRQVT